VLTVPVDKFQSSPGTQAGCYAPQGLQHSKKVKVSILTRHTGRVLRAPSSQNHAKSRVSILTRHTGRVLRCTLDDTTCPSEFQSSPGTQAGCYTSNRLFCVCTPVSILTRHTGRVLLRVSLANRPRSRVSILTRHTGRVLHYDWALYAAYQEFQSSPGTQAGCYQGAYGKCKKIICFNPHPAHRPGAT
jgi:hypothetical protein